MEEMPLPEFFVRFRRISGKGGAKILYDKVRPALEDKRLDNKIKVSIFNTMISSVFLYNSEIWTTKDVKEGLDIYQRTYQRILNIRNPRTITNELLYRTTNQDPW